MRRKRILIVVAVVLAVPLVILAAAFLYLRFADLGAHRPTIERLVSDALGRELRISGAFELEVGRTTKLVAGEVTLANAEWATAPSMISVDRLELAIEPFALLSRTVRLTEITIHGARVVLEVDDAGRKNWVFEMPEREPREDGEEPFAVELGTASLHEVVIVHRDAALSRPLELDLASVEILADDEATLDLTLAGVLDGAPVTLSGRIGPLPELFRAGAVEADLAGRVDDIDVGVRIAFETLGTLEGTVGAVEVRGPDLANATRLLRLPPVGIGPFSVDARLSRATAGQAISLDASLDELTVVAEGVLDSLRHPGAIDLTIQASGRDLAAAGTLARFDRLPQEPFRAAGHVEWNGFPVRLDGVEIEIGENRVAIDGTFGALPRALGTDLRFEGSGPDLGVFATLAGVALPAEPFRVQGRVDRVEDGLRFQEVEARVGAAELSLDGTLGDPPDHAATDLRIRARVPDPSVYRDLVGQRLPTLPLEFEGRLGTNGKAISLEGFVARLGENTFRVGGKVANAKRLVGTDLSVEAEGPDLGWLEPWVGESTTRIPAGTYRVDGRVAIAHDAYILRDVEIRLGDVEAVVDGRLGVAERFEGSEVRIRAHGEDLSILVPMTGIEDLPAEPFSVAGSAKVGANRTEVADVEIRVGSWSVEANGTVGHDRRLSGSALRISAGGPLSALGTIAERSLPDVPTTLEGTVEIGDGKYVTDGFEIGVGRHHLFVDGSMRPAGEFDGTKLDFQLNGPELRELGAWIVDAGIAKVPELPAEPYTVAVGVEVDSDGYVIRGLDSSLGPAVARIDGRLGRPPEFLGTDLTIEVDGPDALLFTALSGVEVPVGSVRIRGGVGRELQGIRFREMHVELGDYRVRANGVLGDPPSLYGSDIDVHAEGPGLALIADLAGRDDLPDESFEIDGHFEGDTRRFKLERFAARLGSSDLRGTFRLDLSGKPRFQGQLASDHVDLVELFPHSRPEPSNGDEGVREESSGGQRRSEKIPRKPFDLELLQEVDADLSWSIAELVEPIGSFRNLDVTVGLEAGALHVGPFAAEGVHGGRLTGQLFAEPGPAGLHVRADLAIENGRLDVSSAEDDPSEWPPIDVALTLEATGDSPHALASTANGRVSVVVGEGAIDSSVLDLVAANFMRVALDATSPFRKENPSSRLECAVFLNRIDDGVARLDPIAIQTDTLTVVGGGRIRLEPETIDLQWQVKPRKGIGVSASTLTNRYFKIGGTLARPRLEVKPMEAMTTTGVAVATAGLSLVGRGLWDRVTADRKVCKLALERAEEKDRKRDEQRDAAEER